MATHSITSGRHSDTTLKLDSDTLSMVLCLGLHCNSAVLFVCKRWTALLYSLKRLWTAIDTPSKMNFLERSYPLLVEFTSVILGSQKSAWASSTNVHLWECILRQRHRVKRLEMEWDISRPEQVLLYAPGGLLPDQLEHLAVSIAPFRRDMPDWTSPHGLRSLCLDSMILISLNIINPIRLTSLRLHVNLERLTIADLLERISLCRQLHDLKLYVRGILGESWPPPLAPAISSLRVVVLTIVHLDILPPILRLIPSSLHKLRVSVRDKIDEESIQGLFDAVCARIHTFQGDLHVSLACTWGKRATETLTFGGTPSFTYELSWYRFLNRTRDRMLGLFKTLIAKSILLDIQLHYMEDPKLCNEAGALVMSDVTHLVITLPDHDEGGLEEAVSRIMDASRPLNVQFPALEGISILPGETYGITCPDEPSETAWPEPRLLEFDDSIRLFIESAVCDIVGRKVPVTF